MPRIISPIILFAVLLTLGVAGVRAQTPTPTPQAKQDKETAKREEKARKEREKEAAKQAERDRKEQEKEAKRQAKIEAALPIRTNSSYDRFKDATIITMVNMLVIGNNNYVPVIYGIADLWLGGAFQYQGQTWTKPSQVILGFETLEAYWEFRDPNNRNLIFIVDGERMNLGMMGQVESVVPYVGNKETLFVILPYETFSKIANAKSIEAQLGRLEFRLEERHMAGLRNLIAPPQ